MNKELIGKKRWIYKFKILCKQRKLIFNLTVLFSLLFLLLFIIICIFLLSKIFIVLPFVVVPISLIYPHSINKKRLEQLYVDLPKEIKPTYEVFVNRYAGYMLIIQPFFNKKFGYDKNIIIELVNNYKEKEL